MFPTYTELFTAHTELAVMLTNSKAISLVIDDPRSSIFHVATFPASIDGISETVPAVEMKKVRGYDAAVKAFALAAREAFEAALEWELSYANEEYAEIMDEAENESGDYADD